MIFSIYAFINKHFSCFHFLSSAFPLFSRLCFVVKRRAIFFWNHSVVCRSRVSVLLYLDVGQFVDSPRFFFLLHYATENVYWHLDEYNSFVEAGRFDWTLGRVGRYFGQL